jgi:hypothetical protein
MKIKAQFFIFFLFIFFTLYHQATAQQRYTLSGLVSEKGSGELLPGVNIYVDELQKGTTSNTYGFYSLSLPAGEYKVSFSYLGYQLFNKPVKLDKNISLDVALQQHSTELQEIEIVADRQKRISQSPQISKISLPVQQIQNMPSLLGEKDVMKVLQLLPGIQSGNEANSGLYVRGGGPGQNLMILDDATIYNANHLFGFFSVFNGDALKNVELYKGGFPARFGGRLSSVIKMDMKEGHKQEYHGKASLGLLSSSAVLEGPILKEKASFLLAARRTYADLLIRPFMSSNSKPHFYFYDFNGKLNAELGDRDRLYVSGYSGQDAFGMEEGNGRSSYHSGLEWGNATFTMRWNHIFSPKLFANASLIRSSYQFKSSFEEKYKEAVQYIESSSDVLDLSFKYDLDYVPSPKHYLRAGALFTHHRFNPDVFVLTDTNSDVKANLGQEVISQEGSFYVEDLWKPSEKLQVEAGLRLSYYKQGNRQFLKPEPRLTAAYMLDDEMSFKASFSEMNQYIHLLSNTGLGLPTDLWVPSTEKVQPKRSWQIAAGMAKDFPQKDFSLTVEGYYKSSRNILEYKQGANFLAFDDPATITKINWEDNVTSGKGWSYGAEIFLQKKYGRLSGWLGYTLSWTKVQFDELNYGKAFWAKQDRRHDVSVAATYQLKPGVTLSGSWVYGSGNALTIANQRIYSHFHQTNSGYSRWNRYTDYFTERGNFRADAYHRLDLGIQFHKQKKHWKRTWDLSLYNVYSRKNPFFYRTRMTYQGSEKTRLIFEKVSLFPILPGVSYRIEF